MPHKTYQAIGDWHLLALWHKRNLKISQTDSNGTHLCFFIPSAITTWRNHNLNQIQLSAYSRTHLTKWYLLQSHPQSQKGTQHWLVILHLALNSLAHSLKQLLSIFTSRSPPSFSASDLPPEKTGAISKNGLIFSLWTHISLSAYYNEQPVPAPIRSAPAPEHSTPRPPLPT